MVLFTFCIDRCKVKYIISGIVSFFCFVRRVKNFELSDLFSSCDNSYLLQNVSLFS